jgi:hypothetical protein
MNRKQVPLYGATEFLGVMLPERPISIFWAISYICALTDFKNSTSVSWRSESPMPSPCPPMSACKYVLLGKSDGTAFTPELFTFVRELPEAIKAGMFNLLCSEGNFGNISHIGNAKFNTQNKYRISINMCNFTSACYKYYVQWIHQ